MAKISPMTSSSGVENMFTSFKPACTNVEWLPTENRTKKNAKEQIRHFLKFMLNILFEKE
jgi:hypothetical protein